MTYSPSRDLTLGTFFFLNLFPLKSVFDLDDSSHPLPAKKKKKNMLKAFAEVDKIVYSPEHPEGQTETIIQAGTPAVDPAVQPIKDQATSRDEAELGLSTPEEYEQHCILFPTYATKQKDDGIIFF